MKLNYDVKEELSVLWTNQKILAKALENISNSIIEKINETNPFDTVRQEMLTWILGVVEKETTNVARMIK